MTDSRSTSCLLLLAMLLLLLLLLLVVLDRKEKPALLRVSWCNRGLQLLKATAA